MLNWRKDKSENDPHHEGPASGTGQAGATNAPVKSPQVTLPRQSGDGPKGRLGDMLVREGAISPAQLAEALTKQRESGRFLGQVLVELSFITQATLVSILVKQCKIPHISLLDYNVSEELFKLVPKELCLKYNLLPIDKLGRILTLAMVDPLDIEALERIRESCPDIKIKPILCDWIHFDSVARRVFQSANQRDLQEATAGSFGLSEKKSPPKVAPAAKTGHSAVDDAVEAIVSEAGAAKPEVKAPQKKDAPARQEQPTLRPAPSAAPVAPIISAEAVSAQVSASVRAVMAEALQPLLAAGTQPRPDARAIATEVNAGLRDALREVLAPLITEHEARFSQMADSMIHVTQSAEAALRGLQDERMRVDDKRQNVPQIANLEIFPGTGQGKLSVAELSDAGALDSPGLGMEADERVREAIDSDRLLSGYTFNEFIVGPANTFALKAARALGEKLARDFNPLYVCGGEGLGKTHLLNAVGNAVLERNPDLRVAYVSTSHFYGAFAKALKQDELSEMRDRFCRWDVLLIDDIQFLAGRMDAQEELFHIFNALVQEGRIVVIAGDCPPDKLPEFQKGLVSRFSSGIVTKLRPPEMDIRLAILKRFADSHRVAVHDEILTLVATRIATDIRRMRGALRKVIAYAKLVEQDITREMANEVLDSLGAEEAA
jgi:chromosomal replication initiator protein DnaA